MAFAKTHGGLAVEVYEGVCFVCLRYPGVTILDRNYNIVTTVPYCGVTAKVEGGARHVESSLGGIDFIAIRGGGTTPIPAVNPEEVGARSVVYIVDETFALACKARGYVYGSHSIFFAGPEAKSIHGLPGYLGLIRAY